MTNPELAQSAFRDSGSDEKSNATCRSGMEVGEASAANRMRGTLDKNGNLGTSKVRAATLHLCPFALEHPPTPSSSSSNGAQHSDRWIVEETCRLNDTLNTYTGSDRSGRLCCFLPTTRRRAACGHGKKQSHFVRPSDNVGHGPCPCSARPIALIRGK